MTQRTAFGTQTKPKRGTGWLVPLLFPRRPATHKCNVKASARPRGFIFLREWNTLPYTITRRDGRRRLTGTLEAANETTAPVYPSPLAGETQPPGSPLSFSREKTSLHFFFAHVHLRTAPRALVSASPVLTHATEAKPAGILVPMGRKLMQRFVSGPGFPNLAT